MNGIDYEKACARYLSHHGYRKIQMTPATGDQGIDLLAVKDHQLYGFQCKYYSRPVGNKAVQQAFAGKTYYGCDCCGVITNNTFTPSAKELAEAADVILMDQITPERMNMTSYILNAVCFILCCAAIGELLETGKSGTSGADSIEAFHALTMLLADALSPFSENHYYAALTAFIAHICSLASAFALMTLYRSVSLLLITVLACIAAVYTGIRLMHLIRIRTEKYTKDMTEQLHTEFNETLTNTGLCFGRLLARDLNAELELVQSHHSDDGTSEFVYHSSTDVSDSLLTVEAMLNHAASQDGIDESYELIPKQDQYFLVRIRIREL